MANSPSTRKLVASGSSFVLTETIYPDEFYSDRTPIIEVTQLIVTGSAMGNTCGVQIRREGASSPYAGIYLTKDEWRMVFAKIEEAEVRG